MNAELNRKHPFPSLVTRTGDLIQEGIDGVHTLKIGRTCAFQIGPYRVAQPLLVYDPADGQPFNLGASVLRKFSATFDYANGKIDLVPGDIAVPEEPYSDAGCVYTADGSGTRVGVVFSGGSADKAGLKSGDLVKSIDGRSTKGMTEENQKHLFKAGSHAVIVERNGRQKMLTLVMPPAI